MPRYIDADALRERVLYRKKPRNHMDDEAGAYDRGFNAGIFAASKEIDSAPTVSPDGVRGVGKWIDKCVRAWSCSCCGMPINHIRQFASFEKNELPNYCPNCGARMEVTSDA